LLWSGKEYDAFIENPALIDPATLEELRLNLVSDQTISSKLGVIDRGEGRINIITTGFTPQHERVSEAIVDLFIKN
jgi:hypothetical protein